MLIKLFLFALIFVTAQACRCVSETSVNKAFCGAKFFGVIRIDEQPRDCPPNDRGLITQVCHNVTVMNAFKGAADDFKQMRTQKYCSVWYEQGKQYLVSGDPINGILNDSMCAYREYWHLYAEQKQNERMTVFEAIEC